MQTLKQQQVHYLLTLVLLFIAPALFANASENIERVKTSAPDYIEILSVEAEGAGVVIKGKTGDNKKLSAYMRLLDQEIGSPDLVQVKQKEGSSLFILKLKKLK